MKKILHNFVLYRMPNEKSINIIEDNAPKAIQSISHLDSEVFVIAPFDLDSEIPLWTFALKNNKQISKSDLSAYSIHIPQKLANKDIISDEETHKATVHQMVSLIKSGNLNKGVISRIKPIVRKEENLIDLFLKLTEAYPKAFVYLSSLPNGEIWCGASPETLAKYSNNVFETMALAGTQLIKERNLKSISWAKKDIHEQQWVQEHLEKLFQGQHIKYKKTSPYTLQAGHLAHICTEYTCDMNTSDALKVLSSLHPTPAVCGTPTLAAKDAILKLENHNRKYYTGFIGKYSPNNFQLFVNLRCMMIDSTHFHLYVGGGITTDSIAEKEWLETEAKAVTMESIIKFVRK